MEAIEPPLALPLDLQFNQEDIDKFSYLLFDYNPNTKTLRVKNWSEFQQPTQKPMEGGEGEEIQLPTQLPTQLPAPIPASVPASVPAPIPAPVLSASIPAPAQVPALSAPSITPTEYYNYETRAKLGVYCNIIDIVHDFKPTGRAGGEEIKEGDQDYYHIITKLFEITEQYLNIHFSQTEKDNAIKSEPEKFFYDFCSKYFDNLLYKTDIGTLVNNKNSNFTDLHLRQIFSKVDTDYDIGQHYYVVKPIPKNLEKIPIITDEENLYSKYLYDTINTSMKHFLIPTGQDDILKGINDSTGVSNEFLVGSIKNYDSDSDKNCKNKCFNIGPDDENLPHNLISFPNVVDQASLHSEEEIVTKEKNYGITKIKYVIDKEDEDNLSINKLILPLYEHKIDDTNILSFIVEYDFKKVKENEKDKLVSSDAHVKMKTSVQNVYNELFSINLNDTSVANMVKNILIHKKYKEEIKNAINNGNTLDDKTINYIYYIILFSLKSLGDKSFSLYRLWKASRKEYLYGFTQDKNASIIDQILMNPYNGLPNTQQPFNDTRYFGYVKEWKNHNFLIADNEDNKKYNELLNDICKYYYNKDIKNTGHSINFTSNFKIGELTPEHKILNEENREIKNLIKELKIIQGNMEFIDLSPNKPDKFDYIDEQFNLISQFYKIVYNQLDRTNPTNIDKEHIYDFSYWNFIFDFDALYFQLQVKSKILKHIKTLMIVMHRKIVDDNDSYLIDHFIKMMKTDLSDRDNAYKINHYKSLLIAYKTENFLNVRNYINFYQFIGKNFLINNNEQYSIGFGSGLNDIRNNLKKMSENNFIKDTKELSNIMDIITKRKALGETTTTRSVIPTRTGDISDFRNIFVGNPLINKNFNSNKFVVFRGYYWFMLLKYYTKNMVSDKLSNFLNLNLDFDYPDKPEGYNETELKDVLDYRKRYYNSWLNYLDKLESFVKNKTLNSIQTIPLNITNDFTEIRTQLNKQLEIFETTNSEELHFDILKLDTIHNTLKNILKPPSQQGGAFHSVLQQPQQPQQQQQGGAPNIFAEIKNIKINNIDNIMKFYPETNEHYLSLVGMIDNKDEIMEKIKQNEKSHVQLLFIIVSILEMYTREASIYKKININNNKLTEEIIKTGVNRAESSSLVYGILNYDSRDEIKLFIHHIFETFNKDNFDKDLRILLNAFNRRNNVLEDKINDIFSSRRIQQPQQPQQGGPMVAEGERKGLAHTAQESPQRQRSISMPPPADKSLPQQRRSLTPIRGHSQTRSPSPNRLMMINRIKLDLQGYNDITETYIEDEIGKIYQETTIVGLAPDWEQIRLSLYNRIISDYRSLADDRNLRSKFTKPGRSPSPKRSKTGPGGGSGTRKVRNNNILNETNAIKLINNLKILKPKKQLKKLNEMINKCKYEKTQTDNVTKAKNKFRNRVKYLKNIK